MGQDSRVYKRRKLLVNAPFQIKYVVMMVNLVVIGLGLMVWGLNSTEAQVNDPVAARRVMRHATAVTAVVYVVCTGFLALWVSHKLAGPLYRLKKSTQAVAEGDLTHRVYLREKDEMGDLREDFNAMLESLHKKVSADTTAAWKAIKEIDDILKDPAVPVDTVQKARRALVEMKSVGKGFKLF
jgi:methyl-accepting chemotaxis protein